MQAAVPVDEHLITALASVQVENSGKNAVEVPVFILSCGLTDLRIYHAHNIINKVIHLYSLFHSKPTKV